MGTKRNDEIRNKILRHLSAAGPRGLFGYEVDALAPESAGKLSGVVTLLRKELQLKSALRRSGRPNAKGTHNLTARHWLPFHAPEDATFLPMRERRPEGAKLTPTVADAGSLATVVLAPFPAADAIKAEGVQPPDEQQQQPAAVLARVEALEKQILRQAEELRVLRGLPEVDPLTLRARDVVAACGEYAYALEAIRAGAWDNSRVMAVARKALVAGREGFGREKA